MTGFRIETDRLLLREWREADAAAMYEIGRNPHVAEFLGPPPTRAEARALVAGQTLNHSLFGHCFRPVERRSDGALIGLCGLNPGPEGTPLEGEIEIGWRLAYAAWGRGFAGEAAAASLAWAWDNLACDRVMAMTVPANMRSSRLMERLGMRRVPGGDFDHPALAKGDPLRRHVTYAIARPAQGVGRAASITAISAASRVDSASARAPNASSAG